MAVKAGRFKTLLLGAQKSILTEFPPGLRDCVHLLIISPYLLFVNLVRQMIGILYMGSLFREEPEK
jgi:hypothetical protein